MPAINQAIQIFAGPDSLDDYNLQEVYEIANITVNGQKAIYGTRTVGLKSRTGFDAANSEAGFMGHDFEVIMRNFNVLDLGGTVEDLEMLPTVQMAAQIYADTGLVCSTEIMLPTLQLNCIAKLFKGKPFLVWNPAVDQLGWHVRQMAWFARQYGWSVGLKNGKWLGEEYAVAEDPNYAGATSLEKTWNGLVEYAQMAPEVILIQRGCDLPGKGEYRNLPVHQTAKRVKLTNRARGVKLFFDPSHSLGPKLRDSIVAETVQAMQIKINDTDYLYDGLLLEVGTAKCDTQQHITVAELRELVERLAEVRELQGRGAAGTANVPWS